MGLSWYLLHLGQQNFSSVRSVSITVTLYSTWSWCLLLTQFLHTDAISARLLVACFSDRLTHDHLTHAHTMVVV